MRIILAECVNLHSPLALPVPDSEFLLLVPPLQAYIFIPLLNTSHLNDQGKVVHN